MVPGGQRHGRAHHFAAAARQGCPLRAADTNQDEFQSEAALRQASEFQGNYSAGVQYSVVVGLRVLDIGSKIRA